MFTGACSPPENLSPRFGAVLVRSAHDCETHLLLIRLMRFQSFLFSAGCRRSLSQDKLICVDWGRHWFHSLFLFSIPDYPQISRPVIRAITIRGGGCCKVALRCYFSVKGRKRSKSLMHVQWVVNKKVTKRELIRGRYSELSENSYGFKAGTTVSRLQLNQKSVTIKCTLLVL